MNAIQFIRHGLETSAAVTLPLIDDMKDRPLAFPTPNGGNHPLWVLGHLAFIEGRLQQLMRETPNPLQHWAPLFDADTEPTGNPADYPSLEEVRAAFVARRAETLRFLETLTDADLERPTHCPPELQKNVGTLGKCLFIIIANDLTHRGQVADARRAAGRKKMYR